MHPEQDQGQIMREKRILIVHDKPAVLDRLGSTLLSLESWDVGLVNSGDGALCALDGGGYDVIAAGVRVADMSGDELLAAVTERFPDTVRILITDPRDVDDLVLAVGCAHQFLAENCAVSDLTRILIRAFRVRDLLQDESLRRLVSELKTLPSLPSLYMEIVRELQSEEPSITRIARAIAEDPGMAAKTLQLVNSVAFGTRLRIPDPVRAAVYLGLDMLRALVLSAGVFKQFEDVELAEVTVGQLWDHSMLVASLARRITEEQGTDRDVLEDAMMAGVLHDVGKLVVAANLPDTQIEAADLARTHRISRIEAEKIVLGATHADIGAYLLGLWGLGDDLVTAVHFHHHPSDAGPPRKFDALAAVHVANAIDHARTEDDVPNVDREYLAALDVDEARIQAWQAVVRE